MQTERGEKHRAHHEFRNHTGEVEVYLEADDFAGLCEEAGRALAELMLGEAVEGFDQIETVSVEGSDRTMLLFNWLNELIFRSEIDKLVFTDFEVVELTDQRLVVRTHGVEPASIRTAVKAATFHRLAVDESPDGLEATVVFDV